MNDLLKQQHSFAHDNAKQILTSFVTWFTFFWTLNAGVLSWLYSPQAIQISTHNSPGRIYLSILFALLNILSMGVCFFCWKAIRQLRAESLGAAEQWIASIPSPQSQPSTGLLPIDFINYIFWGGGISLFMNFIAWILLPILTPS